MKGFLIWLIEKIKLWWYSRNIRDHQHEYTDKIIFPTCTEDGHTLHECSCGDNYTDNTTPSLGHEEVVDEGYPATCEDEGLTSGSHCKRCGKILVEQERIPPLGHTEGDWITSIAATYATEGEEKLTCSECGKTIKTRTVAAYGFKPLNIAVLSDIHEDTSNLYYLITKTNVQAATICLGDYIHNDSSNDNALKKIKYVQSIISDHACGEKIFLKGNHDNNTNNAKGYVRDSQLPFNELYGYRDFDEQGVRLIWVNTSDYDLIHGDTNGKCYDKYGYDFSWNNVPYITLNQLAKIAEYMRTTPEYYSVLLCGHYPTLGAGSWISPINPDYYNGTDRTYGFSIKPLISLIRAFKEHKAVRISYNDYRLNDAEYWWNTSDSFGAVICNISSKENSKENPSLHSDEEIPEEDERGYIDVDFTNNLTNKFIAYFHGHTHNYTCSFAHKIDGDGEVKRDFLEIGFPAVCATRNKGQTNWDAGNCDFYGNEGCTDKYGITENKDITSGSHASTVTISVQEETIEVKDISLNGNGFSRKASFGNELTLEKL